MSSANKCILVIGLEEDDEWRLQREWFRSGLNIPLQFVSDWKKRISTSQLDSQRTWKPDFILFESQDLDDQSFELLKWVRSRPAFRDVILATCSENCSDELASKAYALGADCCVKKTKDFNEVLQLLRRVEAYWFGYPSNSQQAA